MLVVPSQCAVVGDVTDYRCKDARGRSASVPAQALISSGSLVPGKNFLFESEPPLALRTVGTHATYLSFSLQHRIMIIDDQKNVRYHA